MGKEAIENLMGQRVTLRGHFESPVALQGVRSLGDGYGCEIRLADGSVEEPVISSRKALAAPQGRHSGIVKGTSGAEPPSCRIRCDPNEGTVR